jgi:glucokinase
VTHGAPGRRPIGSTARRPAGGAVLALDIGGTKLAAGLVEPDGGTITRAATAPTPRGDAEQVWRAVAALAGPHLAEGPALAAIGVGCPGPLGAAGTVSPVNIPAWRDFPLRARLADLTGVPVTLANDAVCAAFGEYRRGAGQGAGAMLGMVVSTGVGGGLILGGQVYQGPTGNAGNIGHAIADPDGEPCPCGGAGCVETIASGPSMVRRARAAGWPGRPGATAADLATDAARGHPAAAAALAGAARALGIAIVSAAALTDLDVVVIGGGVAAAGDLLLGPLTEQCGRHGGNAFVRRLRVTLAALTGPAAGLIGAAALAATADREPAALC